ncbi:hypothetical protein BH20ACT5_BH20ACT5_25370 [soil metagenome]
MTESAELDTVAAELVRERRYAAIEAITPYLPGLDGPARTDIIGLCRFAIEVLELDAEDFDTLRGVPPDLLAMVQRAHIPKRPDAADRGALTSLVPTYRLFLEVLAVRWDRGELSSVLAVVHLISEYLPLLAWEPVLGHAGDPARLGTAVAGPGSRWGTDDRECDHPPAIRRALRSALELPAEDTERWDRYLDRDHSRVSGALGQCASHARRGRPEPTRTCTDPCSVWTRLEPSLAQDLERRMTLVGVFANSPVLALRHAAPVGHGFGVPDRRELLEDWEETWARLTRPWADGVNPLAGVPAAGEPLPGLASFLSVVAGIELTPLGVLDRVDELLALRLEVTAEVAQAASAHGG